MESKLLCYCSVGQSTDHGIGQAIDNLQGEETEEKVLCNRDICTDLFDIYMIY